MFDLFIISLAVPDILYYSVAGLVFGVVALLFFLEILLKVNDVPYDNVNFIIRKWAFGKHFFITFFSGVIGGHLFLGTNYNWLDCKSLGISFGCDVFNVIVIAGITLLIWLAGLLFQKKKTSMTFQVIVFGVGLIAGHIIWSMNVFR